MRGMLGRACSKSTRSKKTLEPTCSFRSFEVATRTCGACTGLHDLVRYVCKCCRAQSGSNMLYTRTQQLASCAWGGLI